MRTVYANETTLGLFRVVRTWKDTNGTQYVTTRPFPDFDCAEAEAQSQAKQNVGHLVEVVQVTGQYSAVAQVVKYQEAGAP